MAHILDWPDPYPTYPQQFGEYYRAGMRQGRVAGRPEYTRPRPNASANGPIIAYFAGYDEALAVYNAGRGEQDETLPDDENEPDESDPPEDEDDE